jgi:hypothetical protein
MPLTTAERVTLYIRCSKCMKSTQKSLAWLIRQNEITRAFCDGYIDLRIGKQPRPQT